MVIILVTINKAFAPRHLDTGEIIDSNVFAGQLCRVRFMDGCEELYFPMELTKVLPTVAEELRETLDTNNLAEVVFL